eukprot:6212624-Pleurochrysis_carterae.AAC.3
MHTLPYACSNAHVRINAAKANAPTRSLYTSARTVLGERDTYARPGREGHPVHYRTVSMEKHAAY